MKVFGIIESNFYTEEHGFSDYVAFTDSLEKAQEYVSKKYAVKCNEDETVVYCEEDDDDEYGERSVTISQIKIQ